MITKFCKYCSNSYPVPSEHWTGKQVLCRKYNRDRVKRYLEHHKEKQAYIRAQYVLNNRDKVNKINRKSYYRNSHKWKDTRKKYERNQYATNIEFKLRKRLRIRIRSALFRNQKTGSAVRDLGCSIPEFKLYLENLFQPGMSWDNYGKEWHIDHIIPLARFNLDNRAEFVIACNYTNLQPLWAIDNLKKSDF